MPVIQQLNRQQILECLDEAASRQAPVILSCHVGATWHNLHTQILRRAEEKLWLAEPSPDPAGRVVRLAADTALGLSFKLRHHKHMFTARLEAICPRQAPRSGPARALCVPVPQRMERIQRRAFIRVDVPRSRSVLATFWQGGLANSADAVGKDAVRWEGWVTNLSAGGFQVRMPSQSVPPMESGDAVGVRMDLGQEFPPLLADAQFRHQVDDDRGVTLLGFQFVGLNESAHGRGTLRLLAQVVARFSHAQGRRIDRDVA